jgi:hypothetical protein
LWRSDDQKMEVQSRVHLTGTVQFLRQKLDRLSFLLITQYNIDAHNTNAHSPL